jgi:hypothetical protein
MVAPASELLPPFLGGPRVAASIGRDSVSAPNRARLVGVLSRRSLLGLTNVRSFGLKPFGL